MSDEPSLNVVRHDLLHYTDFQNEIYGAPTRDSPVIPLSIFHNDSNKILAYSSGSTLPLESTRGEKDYIYNYTVSNKFHKLMNVYATLKLPEIKVASGFSKRVQIALCKNPLHNIISSATLRINTHDGTFTQTVNTFTADVYRAKDCLNPVLYDYMIGNREELIHWTSNLNTMDELFMPLKFFMDEETNASLSIHMYPNCVSFKHQYELSLKKLIKMRIKDNDGVWQSVIPEMSFLQYDKDKLDAPTIWGCYRMMEHREDDGRNPKKPESGVVNDENREYEEERENGCKIFIKDYKHLKEVEVRHNLNYDLINEKSAALGVRYAFLNCKAALFNNHSNYSLYHDRLSAIADPQESYSLSFGTDERVTDRATIHSTLVPSFYLFRANNCEIDNTIHDIPFDTHPYRLDPDTTVVFRQPSILSCTLRNEEDSRKDKQVHKNEYPDLSQLSRTEKMDTVINYTRKTFSECDLDDSTSKKFIFKGYARVLRMVTFKISSITIAE